LKKSNGPVQRMQGPYERKKVSASGRRTRILNQGSGGRGQQDFGFI
jgi:hypothetical protein